MKIEKIPPDIKNVPLLAEEFMKSAAVTMLVVGLVVGAVVAGLVVFAVMR